MRPRASLSTTECQACPNRSTADLCNLDGPAATEFENIRHRLDYHPGQFVFYEGHAALGLYILRTGRVKLTRSTPAGQRRLVGIADPGMLIERHSFHDESIHEVTCEALEPSQVCIIDRSKYLALLEQNGDRAVKVIKLLSRQIGVSLDETDHFAFASARQRIATLLLELAERYHEPAPQGTRITLQLKREELAQMAAMTVETTVRTLKAFQDAHLIKTMGRDITILEPDRLARAARGSTALGPLT